MSKASGNAQQRGVRGNAPPGFLVRIRSELGFPMEIIMRAVTATAVVHPDHTLTVQIPEDIPPGTHQVVIVLQDSLSPRQQKIFLASWEPHDVGIVDPTMTFRREDIYGDDGR
jgi:hypothetical protein